MGGLLIRALLGALVNEKVVDRLLTILDHAIKRRNDEQTEVLRAEVESLHRQNMERFTNVEHGLERLGVRVRKLERRVFQELELTDELPLLEDHDRNLED